MMAIVPLLPGEILAVSIFNHVKLTTHNGQQIPLVGLLHKFEHPKHVAVIGNGTSLLAVGLGFVQHGWNGGGSIQQGILGMYVKVNEFRHAKGLADLTWEARPKTATANL